MNSPILYIALCALMVANAYIILFSIPRLLRSLFRYKVWKIRDEMMRDIVTGKLPENAVTMSKINYMERMIELSGDLTLFTVFIAIPFYIGVRRSFKEVKKANNEVFDAVKMTEEQTKLTAAYEKKADHALGIHLLCGNPSGWLALPLLFVVFVIALAVQLIGLLFKLQPLVFELGCLISIKYIRRASAYLLGLPVISKNACDSQRNPPAHAY